MTKSILAVSLLLLLLLTACEKQQVVNHVNYKEYKAFCKKNDAKGRGPYCMFYKNRGINAFDLNNGGE